MSSPNSNKTPYLIIMAGGHGTRLWPSSTRARPKQYLKFVGDESLLAQTAKRFDGFIPVPKRFVVTTEAQEKICRQTTQGLVGEQNIFLEPSGRNTAPCIFLSLLSLIAKGAGLEDVVAIVPSDHVILDTKGFQSCLKKSVLIASEDNKLLTIGIRPHFPHTGFGYIQKGGLDPNGHSFSVVGFKEKPAYEVACSYLESGDYLWNAGMFVGKLGIFFDEFKAYSPQMDLHKEELLAAIKSGSGISACYDKLEKISIDYAVMEKTRKLSVLPSEFDWNDLGSWDALEQIQENKASNLIYSSHQDSYQEDSSGNIIFSPTQFVSVVGLKDFIVVSEPKALMIVPKSQAQSIKNIVKFIEEKGLGDDLL